MNSLKRFLVPGGKAFTPRGLLTRAGVLALLFLVCHLAGLRAHTSILTGTFTGGSQLSSLLGVTYVLTYLAFVLGVPVLLIAAGLLALLGRLRRP